MLILEVAQVTTELPARQLDKKPRCGPSSLPDIELLLLTSRLEATYPSLLGCVVLNKVGMLLLYCDSHGMS